MNRDDGLLWISLFWFVVLCGLALWALLRLWGRAGSSRGRHVANFERRRAL